MQKSEHPPKNQKAVKDEFRSFDHAVSKIVRVSHAELQDREVKWKKQRKLKARR